MHGVSFVSWKYRILPFRSMGHYDTKMGFLYCDFLVGNLVIKSAWTGASIWNKYICIQ